jgi:sucrose-6-phosphate hydrolase SacC (GH32 family)
VLTAANGQYAVGSFDGFTFKPEAERLNGQLGRDFYASQTFDAEPEGRRIEIGWWRTHTNKDNMNFNQAMSIPLELQLVLTKDGPRLTRTPVKELESLRTATHYVKAGTLKAGDADPLANIHTGLTEIRTTLKPGASSEITLTIHGLPIVYANGKITIDGVTAPAPLIGDKLELVIYVDKIGVELFAGKGLMFMPVNKNIDVSKRSLSLEVKGDAVAIERMSIHELKSTW